MKNEIIKLFKVAAPMVLYPSLNFSYLLLVANYSSIEEYGALAFSVALSSIVITFADAGLKDYFLTRSEDKEGKALTVYLYKITLSLSLFLYIVTLVYCFLIYGIKSDQLLLLMALIFEIFALSVLQKNLMYNYQKNDNIVRFSKIEVVAKALPITVKVVVYLVTHNILASTALGGGAFFLFYIMWWRSVGVNNKMVGVKVKLSYVFGFLYVKKKEWLPFFISFLSFFLYFSTDRIVIGSVLGEVSLALYTVAYSFMLIGQLYVSAVWTTYMPKMSKSKDLSVFSRVNLFIRLSGFLIFIGYLFIAGIVIPWLYPNEYQGAVGLLAILSVYFVFRCTNVVDEMLYVAEEKYHVFVKFRVLAGVCNLLLNVLLIKYFGVIVAAITTVLAEAIISIAILAVRRKEKKCLH